MDNTSNNINDISKLYSKITYFDQYGGSVVLFIVITIVVLIFVSYFHTMIHIQPIVADWPNQRCKPTIMPFAGFITRPDGMSAADYTAQNFNYCTQNILSGITGHAVQPLAYITDVFQIMLKIVEKAIQDGRAMFNKVRNDIKDVSEEIMGRVLNIVAPLQLIIISFRDFIGKVQGTMTAGLFTLLSVYDSLKSLLGAIAQFLVIILITLAVMIAMFWIFPFTWGFAIVNTAIFVAVAIPLAIMLAFMSETLHIKTGLNIPHAPGPPKLKCFDKSTELLLANGSYKKIVDIQVGDVLIDNNVVTGKMKVDTTGSTMYRLGWIIVSDSHIVKCNGKWIPVSKHPGAFKIDDYTEPYLYCLNTSRKIIDVDGIIFSDWDELYNESLEGVLNNKSIHLSNIQDIHIHLDGGFAGTTPILLKNGETKRINQIQINDVLSHGEKVYGIVEIKGDDLLDQYSYHLGENFKIEGYLKEFAPQKESIVIEKHKKLYHLLTDSDNFHIGAITVGDYNSVTSVF